MKRIIPPFTPPVPESPTSDGDDQAADVRDGQHYIFSEKAKMAVRVAMAIERPLLVSGPSGCGKSALAASVARYYGWRYIETTVTSRSQAQDLLWRFDSVQRLRDAQAGDKDKIEQLHRYVEPGCLWWAYAPQNAERRGVLSDQKEIPLPNPPYPLEKEWNHDPAQPAVVLIDEIDKADPDFPNSLLVPLGSLVFHVHPIPGVKVQANEPCGAPLLIITTNQERRLPEAFLRRCVDLRMDFPKQEDMHKIAKAHFPEEHHDLCAKVINEIMPANVGDNTGAAPASPAEILDLIRACWKLSIKPDDSEFTKLMEMTVNKPSQKDSWS